MSDLEENIRAMLPGDGWRVTVSKEDRVSFNSGDWRAWCQRLFDGTWLAQMECAETGITERGGGGTAIIAMDIARDRYTQALWASLGKEQAT